MFMLLLKLGYLDQEDLKVLVNHKIVSEDLETVWDAFGVNLRANCSERVCYQTFHLREEISHKANIFTAMTRVKIPLEVINWKFVSTLKATIVFWIHLNCIVGQVNEARVQVSQIELLRRGSEIAVAVHITFDYSIDWSEQSIAPYIELSIIDQ